MPKEMGEVMEVLAMVQDKEGMVWGEVERLLIKELERQQYLEDLSL